LRLKSATEKDFIIDSQHFTFRLRSLYFENEAMFYDICDYLPNAVHINNRHNLDYYYANNKMLNKGYEMEILYNVGAKYLTEISCPYLLKASLDRVKRYNQFNDSDAICFNPQQVSVNKEMTYIFSNKIILNDNKFFNLFNFADEMGVLGKLYQNILKPVHRNKEIWQQFQSLTKQEKKVLRLLANGKSNNDISDALYISKYTVHSHRKNINKKLDTSNLADLIKFAMALDIL
jgi:DNA-binding CsgD family transcriptional regulator